MQDMAPIDSVTFLKCDITMADTAEAILSKFAGERVDLILCDGAPEVTGVHQIDQNLHAQLIAAALLICKKILVKNGTFVAKVFRGTPEANELLHAQLRTLFPIVHHVKPTSSRDRSAEAFVVCQQFLHDLDKHQKKELLTAENHPFLQTGDLSYCHDL
mmetsp:Transcript_7815/g.10904  ORF Transcript_7815/g.10904 Transcript_7815/m.10904 type:complete len:159 (+) Transcript_7815:309-785(+)